MNLPAQKATNRADELYSRREQIDNVRVSVEILLEAAKTCSQCEIDWRLGRAFFFLGQEAESGNVSLNHHLQGVEICEGAIARKAPGVEAYFWLGVNLALCAQQKSALTAIRYAWRAKRELLRAAEIDASYHAAGPLRVLGRLDHKLPRWLGGQTSRALLWYERAISIAPGNTVTRVYLAELLLELGDKELARAQLESIFNAPDDPEWFFEIERDRRIARSMLMKLGEVPEQML